MRRMLTTVGLVVALLSADRACAVDYSKDVKPLLKHKCYACHGALKQQSKLRLDTAAALRKGGESGSAFDPKNPKNSLILQAVRGTAGFQMPPDGQGTRLTADEIQLLETWLIAGAQGPTNEVPQADPTSYWSYRLPVEEKLPAAGDGWARTPIDRLIAAQHVQHQLQPRPAAPPETWLRRVYIDLIGLPPTRVQLLEFKKRCNGNPKGTQDAKLQQAKKQVVGRLLASPQYGERWGRHWMDIWRYSDWYGSRGINEIRYSQRHIWRWRDWIVESLNADKGYDQMIREMLSADEIAADDPKILPATGFLGRNWYKFDRNVWMFDTVERTSEAFLGLKLRCCRCHDHKYDPISHEEYYRFRAFFEPHDVRTDPISATTGTEKDATLGQVLKDGIARVYDKEHQVKTYRFERGDNRYPDKSKTIEPGVPAALGGDPIEIQIVKLPPEAFYPALRKDVVPSLLASSDLVIEAARKALKKSSDKVAVAEQTLKDIQARIKQAGKKPDDASKQDVHLHDDFSKEDTDRWKVINGDWKYENGHLVQKSVTSFATIVTKQDHPRNMYVRFKYRPLKPGTYRSIGFSFDYQDKGASQDVYTSTGDSSQSIQAFHRVGGKQVYPQAGIVKVRLKLDEVATVEAFVQGSRLKLKLNGEDKLDYVMPVPRQAGKFAIWVHQGSAEIHELEIKEFVPNLADATRVFSEAIGDVVQKKRLVEIAKAEKRCLEVRIEAELAKYSNKDAARTSELAKQADICERQVAVLKQHLLVSKAQVALKFLKRQPQSSKNQNQSKATSDAIAKAEKALEAAHNKELDLQNAVGSPDGKYEPIGKIFPSTSTGRRKALADWIASAKNPRTARVAANHIWGRHFGIPLVSTTDNFGLNGTRPSHPELLNWLSLELIRNKWQMKPLHRQIVLSATYAMLSSDGAGAHAKSNKTRDPKNTFLWRMNSQRMTAEVVRDSVLHLAGKLDLQRGGAEIPQTQGETVYRRSMYFRNTPNEKMLFLEVFDVADPNACYRRKESVVPHQALALMNSGLSQDQARLLAIEISNQLKSPASDPAAQNKEFIEAAFEQVLTRSPRSNEIARCVLFLQPAPDTASKTASGKFPSGGSSKTVPATDLVLRRRQELIHVLFLHNDFVTVR